MQAFRAARGCTRARNPHTRNPHTRDTRRTFTTNCWSSSLATGALSVDVTPSDALTGAGAEGVHKTATPNAPDPNARSTRKRRRTSAACAAEGMSASASMRGWGRRRPAGGPFCSSNALRVKGRGGTPGGRTPCHSGGRTPPRHLLLTTARRARIS
ncbi:hypothetical protein EON67_11140 [archaeon]|nr:MAG: hypothetical protein EON67_11140 [archaeon]